MFCQYAFLQNAGHHPLKSHSSRHRRNRMALTHNPLLVAPISSTSSFFILDFRYQILKCLTCPFAVCLALFSTHTFYTPHFFLETYSVFPSQHGGLSNRSCHSYYLYRFVRAAKIILFSEPAFALSHSFQRPLLFTCATGSCDAARRVFRRLSALSGWLISCINT